jgi:hypothetical protein
LLAALEQKVNMAPNLRLRFLCTPHHHDTPLHPIIRHIERAAGFERGDSPARRWEKFTRLLGPNASKEDLAVFDGAAFHPQSRRSAAGDDLAAAPEADDLHGDYRADREARG